MRAGGYRTSSIGEDFDLVARLHRLMRDEKKSYRVVFVPDPVCWTEVPPTLRALGRQRVRWQKGLIDVLWSTRDMLFRKKYGRIGAVALPYLWLFEFLAPVIEMVGISSIILGFCLHAIHRVFFMEFLIYGYLFAAMISVGAVLQEEVTYRRYNDWRDVARLICFCFLEQFPYRQMYLVWRLQGTWQFLRGDMQWKQIERVGISTAAAQKARSVKIA